LVSFTSLAPAGVAVAVAEAVGVGAAVAGLALGCSLGGDSLPSQQAASARHSRGENERSDIGNSEPKLLSAGSANPRSRL
jgi:hypothetical protein